MPVEWYKKEDTVVFLFEKIRKIGYSKLTTNKMILDKADSYFGGCRISDKRRYLRFVNSNRKDIAKEYCNKVMEEQRLKNLKIRRENENNGIIEIKGAMPIFKKGDQ